MARARRYPQARIVPGCVAVVWLGVACGGSGLGETPDAASDAALDVRVPVQDGGTDARPPESATMDGATFATRDAGPLCVGEMCSPASSTGCDAPQSCVLMPVEARCADRSSDAREQGMPCQKSTECAVGLACFRRGDAGVCAQVCCPRQDNACESLERRCRPVPLYDGTETSWGGCLQPEPCDVLRPVETCDPGEACYIVSPRGETGCRNAGGSRVGEGCEKQYDCRPGLSCVGLETSTCARICGIGPQDTVSCPDDEGQCQVYSQSPRGTGLCAQTPTP